MSNYNLNQLELFHFIKSIDSQINLPSHLSEFVNSNLDGLKLTNSSQSDREATEKMNVENSTFHHSSSPSSPSPSSSPSSSSSSTSPVSFLSSPRISLINNNVKKKNMYKGVFKCGKKFKAQIQTNGTQHYLGLYKTPEEAAKVYDKYARVIFFFFFILSHLIIFFS